MRISDWSSDVCSSDLARVIGAPCAFASLPAKGSAANPPSIVRREICRALVMQETWRRGAECQKAALPKLFAALGRGGDGAGHQGLKAVLGHEDIQRLQRGADGRGHVLAQLGSRLASDVHQLAR